MAHLLLLLVLLGLLLRLGLLDGRLPLGCADLRGLVPASSNGSEVGTNDSALVLDGLARPLLGNLLRDTLLVHAPVNYCPGDLARVLALQEERLGLRGREPEDLDNDRCQLSFHFLPGDIAPCCLRGRRDGPC